MFDALGDKVFPDVKYTFNVGPPGREQVYTPPAGWTRYGLKVLGKYADDRWLHPFQHANNWYRAFHGTGHAQKSDFGDKNQSIDINFAPVDAAGNIYKTGFRQARVAVYGEGVYCSPDPKVPENGYVRPVSLETQQGTKKYICMLQVVVNPDGVAVHCDNKIWVVADVANIRPYGILIKEV